MVATFVINLDRDPRRLAHMKDQASRAGITFERLPAVLGASVPEHLRAKFEGSPLMPGEIGCYASHLLIYETIVERGLKSALVLEDDVALCDCFAALTDATLKCLPVGWDLVKLCNRPTSWVHSVTQLSGNHRLVRFLHFSVLAGGYLVSASGAQKMLSHDLRTLPIDFVFCRPWVFGLDIYGVMPAPVRQLSSLGSHIMDFGGRIEVTADQRKALKEERSRYLLKTIGPGGMLAYYAKKKRFRKYTKSRLRGFRKGRNVRLSPSQIEEIQCWFAGKQFTSDWPTSKLEPWFVLLDKMRSKEVNVLDVGSYDGRSAVAFLSLLRYSHVTCIDTFEPDQSDDEMLRSVNSSEFEKRFDHNLQAFGNRVIKIRDFAANALDRLATSGAMFDVIYIDAAKPRDSVRALSVLAWPLLKEGGVMIWDDLKWDDDKPSSERTGDAVRSFCRNLAGCLKILHEDSQMIIRKSSQWLP